MTVTDSTTAVGTARVVVADPRVLQAACKNAVLFSERSELRPVLHGALFELEKDLVRVVATDSYRLLVQEFPAECSGIDIRDKFIVDRDDLAAWAKVKVPANDKRPPVLEFTGEGSDRSIVASFPGSTLTGRLVDGDFPNWRQLVEKPSECGAPALFNPAFLADFGKLEPLSGESRARWNGAVRVMLNENGLKPARFELTQQGSACVYGLLMPVRDK